MNKSKINVTNGWLDFYINKEDKSILTAFISEFDMEEGASVKPSSDGFMAVEGDSDLPF